MLWICPIIEELARKWGKVLVERSFQRHNAPARRARQREPHNRLPLLRRAIVQQQRLLVAGSCCFPLIHVLSVGVDSRPTRTTASFPPCFVPIGKFPYIVN